jgi:hypothetical protein
VSFDLYIEAWGYRLLIVPFDMLARYLSGFSVQFMHAVLSLLSAYDVAMVAYTCREGKNASDLFREGIYQVSINRLFVPAPNYTVDNFYSRFCLCDSCGENPRISLYSWSFLPKSQRALAPNETWPPVFDTKCHSCTMNFLYWWFESGKQVYFCNDSFLEDDRNDTTDHENELMEHYWKVKLANFFKMFLVTIFKPIYHPRLCTCKYCNNVVTKDDRVVWVRGDKFMSQTSHVHISMLQLTPDIYHIECFFSHFALWKHCGQMTIEEQTLPSIEVI